MLRQLIDETAQNAANGAKTAKPPAKQPVKEG
jgi:hypothetical protein